MRRGERGDVGAEGWGSRDFRRKSEFQSRRSLGVTARSKAVINKCPCARIFSQLRDGFLRVNSAARVSRPPAPRCRCCVLVPFC